MPRNFSFLSRADRDIFARAAEDVARVAALFTPKCYHYASSHFAPRALGHNIDSNAEYFSKMVFTRANTILFFAD